MDFFLIIGISQVLLFSGLLFSKREKKKADVYLLAWFLLAGFHLLFYHISFNDLIDEKTNWLIFGFFFPLLYGPLLYFYVVELTRVQRISLFYKFLHLSPFLILSLSIIIYQSFYSTDPIYLVREGQLLFYSNAPEIFQNNDLFMAIQGGFYPFFNLWLLQKHRQNINHQFSNLQLITLNWLKVFILIMLVGYLLIALVLFFGDPFVGSKISKLNIVAGILSIEVFFLGFYGIKQTQVFTESSVTLTIEKNTPKYAKSGFSSEKAQRAFLKLEKFMREKKPFLDSGLTLQKLASDLDLPPNHLSQLINSHYEQNFYDFINSQRVKKAASMLKDPSFSNITILHIAFESGFNSKAPFNNAFKKHMGMTPSSFRKKHLS